jgi:hypothetical protein
VTLSGTGAFQVGHFTSLLLTGDAQPTIDASGQSAAFVNQLSTADFGVSAAHINPDGSIAPPPVAP